MRSTANFGSSDAPRCSAVEARRFASYPSDGAQEALCGMSDRYRCFVRRLALEFHGLPDPVVDVRVLEKIEEAEVHREFGKRFAEVFADVWTEIDAIRLDRTKPRESA